MTAVYKKMSIANKLMMAPLLVAVLLLGFGIFSYVNMQAFQTSVNDMLADSVATERMAQETEATVNATHAAAYRSLALLNLKSDKAAQSAEAMMTEQLTALGDVGRDLSHRRHLRISFQPSCRKTGWPRLHRPRGSPACGDGGVF